MFGWGSHLNRVPMLLLSPCYPEHLFEGMCGYIACWPPPDAGAHQHVHYVTVHEESRQEGTHSGLTYLQFSLHTTQNSRKRGIIPRILGWGA